MDVRVSVFENACNTTYLDDRGDWPPDDLAGFIAWFQGKLDNYVPEQCRHKVNIDLEADGDRLDLSIYYYRPETNEEIDARVKWERECRRQVERDTEVNERREYERLKVKFGG